MKFRFLLFALVLSSHAAPPLMYDTFDDIRPNEVKRLPQFILDFYQALKDTTKEVHQALINLPNSFFNSLQKYPHADEAAHVRYCPNDELCLQEKEYVERRLAIVKKHIEQTFNITLDPDRVPRIAYCFSGGGFRSMILTIGFLTGAQSSNGLNDALYIAGLSGSTWAIAPWIASGKTLIDFFEPLSIKLDGGMAQISSLKSVGQMVEQLINKMYYKQLISVIDIYGHILANTLLAHTVNDPLRVTISESHKAIVDGSKPMPIYTAIHSNIQPYEWLEFTPFEVGSAYLKSYIPTWAFGRKFKEGVSVNNAPEQTLGFYMGIFGSAFELNLKDIIRMTADNIAQAKADIPSFVYAPLKKITLLILNSILGDIRLFPAILANFTFQHEKSPIKDERELVLIDAGIDFNLPLPPLLRDSRKVDIIIIYYASASINGAPELYRAERYARRKGIKFPKINYEGIDQKTINVFSDPNDPETPIIVYFPRIKNELYCTEFDPEICIAQNYCNTYNFAYTKEQVLQLCGLAEFTIKQNHHIVQDIIKDVLVRKYGYQLPA
jgi:phospholipase A2